jgi:hypothetical protein
MPFTQVWDDKVHLFGGEAVYAHFFVFADWSTVDTDLGNAFQFLVSIRVAGVQFWSTGQVALQNGAITANVDPTVTTLPGVSLSPVQGEIDDWSAIDGTGKACAFDAGAAAVTFLVAGKADVTIPIRTLTALVGQLGGTAGALLGGALGGLFGAKVRVSIGHSNVSIPIHRDGSGKITQIGATNHP